MYPVCGLDKIVTRCYIIVKFDFLQLIQTGDLMMKFAAKALLMAVCFCTFSLFAENDNNESISDLKKRATGENPDSRAQYKYAFYFLEGRGVTRNEKEAFSWFMKSAENGYAHAQCMVGLCYAFGKGVNQDDKKALEYFMKAAEKDVAEAYYNIGYFYEKGRGGKKENEEEAKRWYQKAAGKDHAAAKDALSRLTQAKEQPEEEIF